MKYWLARGGIGAAQFPSRVVQCLAMMAVLAGCLVAVPGRADAGIVLCWQFNDSLTDASTSGNNASFYDASLADPLAAVPTYAAGRFGNAVDINPLQMVFRGVLESPFPDPPVNLPTLAADAWTVNIWTNLANPNPTAHTVLGGFGTDPGGTSIKGTKRFLRLRYDSGVGNPLSFWGNSAGYDYDLKDPLVEYPDAIGPDAWHMVTATFAGGEGGMLTMYLDGDKIGSVARTFVDTPGAGNLVARVGGDVKTPPVSTNTFDGMADDFAIWNQSLSAGMVKASWRTPYCGFSALTTYDAVAMEKLVGVYQNAGGTTSTIGSLTWEYASAISGHSPGDIWHAGGMYYMLFDDAGNGVKAVSGLPVADIPGDANHSGTVDADDARLLAQNWGTATGAAWEIGDFNSDGAVNAADASILAANWGRTSAMESTGAVPEPSMLALLFGLAAGALAFRRGRTRP